MAQEYTVPQFHIVAKSISSAADGTRRYAWSITMKASDAGGARVLGYRASGWIDDKTDGMQVQFEAEPQVHDEKRPVWTTMNLTDRPEIRKKIESRAKAAIGKLKASGKDTFECKVD